MQPKRYYRVQGTRKLTGSIEVTGAKNAVMKQLVCAMLSRHASTLTNVPQIADLQRTVDMARHLGAQITVTDSEDAAVGRSMTIHAEHLAHSEIPLAIAGNNRMAILFLAPLLHRLGQATLPRPGGCKIGPRPVDFHITAYRKMGAVIEETDEGFHASAPDGLRGADIKLDYPSVSTTESLIMAASLAEGVTYIRNAALEPEVIDLIKMLQKMGGLIELKGDRSIVVTGVSELRGTEHRVIVDRIQVASFACLGIATEGDIFVKGANQEDLLNFLNVLNRIGGGFEIAPDGIRFFYKGPLQSIVLESDVHPGFATDYQQPMTLLLSRAHGMSVVHETVFENRFHFLHQLRKMGLVTEIYTHCLGEKPCRFRDRGFAHSCIIHGPGRFRSAELYIPDLRAGFSYLIAALVADGESKLYGVENIERGYDFLVERLRSVGAEIELCEATGNWSYDGLERSKTRWSRDRSCLLTMG